MKVSYAAWTGRSNAGRSGRSFKVTISGTDHCRAKQEERGRRSPPAASGALGPPVAQSCHSQSHTEQFNPYRGDITIKRLNPKNVNCQKKISFFQKTKKDPGLDGAKSEAHEKGYNKKKETYRKIAKEK